MAPSRCSTSASRKRSKGRVGQVGQVGRVKNDPLNSPTITSPAMTRAGVIMGTAAYMSPEQAKGRLADRRSDVWAFGCVLYEMLSGVSPFAAGDIAETLAAVLRQDVDWTKLPAGTPPAIHRLLRRCLVRDARMRLPDIGVARLEIDEALTPAGAAISMTARDRRPTLAIAAASLIGLAIGAALIAWLRPGAAPAIVEPRALQVLSGPGVSWPRLSPDGRSVAFVRDGRLFVRALDGLTDRAIDTDPGVTAPTWSPDGSSIAYFVPGDIGAEIRIVPAQGGPSRVAARRVPQGANARAAPFPPFGIAWCASGLLFARWAEGLWLVTDDGRESLAFPLDRPAGDRHFGYPSCLPDGRVLVTAERGNRQLITVLGNGSRVSLLEIPTNWDVEGVRWPVLAPGNQVVFDRADENVGLWALPVDAGVTAATGPPKQVLAGADGVSVSATGLLLTLTGTRVGERQLVWVDRAGAKLATFGSPQADLMWPSLSPAGDRVVVQGGRDGIEGVWIHDGSTARGLIVTAAVGAAAWSPRGDRIAAVRVIDDAERELVLLPSSGGEPVPVGRAPNGNRPAWTPDGQSLVYNADAPETAIWVQAIAPGAQPRRLITGIEPAVSPDGRYLAFSDNTSGRRQVYVTTFPEPGEFSPVSNDAARHPRWSRKGSSATGPTFSAAA